jgi:hypothetical protein
LLKHGSGSAGWPNQRARRYSDFRPPSDFRATITRATKSLASVRIPVRASWVRNKETNK